MDADSFLIGQALDQATAAISYHVGRRLTELVPDRALLEADAESFDLIGYAAARHCALVPKSNIYCQLITEYCGAGEGIRAKARNAWYEVEWNGESLDVLLMSWPANFCDQTTCWIMANSERTAGDFFEAVCEWSAEIRHEVLVFDGHTWCKDADLYQSIQGATFGNLILPGTLREEIRTDIARFFAAQDAYQRYGVPWKRGILLTGPPGNGKTHAVKAIIHSSQKPCLYVKSFKSHYSTEHDNIRKVFVRARKSAPCVLVLEDLDSLIDDDNRAFFLNELDGFAENSGILTVATTNHPHRLDSAIADRPSRFDRKYHFPLPAHPERLAYIALWNQSLPSELKLTEDGMRRLAEATEQFSFAYLKELFLSSSMKWIADPESSPMDDVAIEQAQQLREQMSSPTTHSITGGMDRWVSKRWGSLRNAMEHRWKGKS